MSRIYGREWQSVSEPSGQVTGNLRFPLDFTYDGCPRNSLEIIRKGLVGMLGNRLSRYFCQSEGGRMDNITCVFCGMELKDDDSCYGLTRGAIDENCFGFKVDDDSDWDIYCPTCMNLIDKLMADYKRELTT
jgi:hypothetical protein